MKDNYRDEILDLPKQQQGEAWTTWLFAGAILLFAYWYVAPFVDLPLAQTAVFFGLVLLLVVMVKRFWSSPKTGLYPYFYFFGKLSLLVGVYLHIAKLPFATFIFWISFAFFGLGLAMLLFKKKSD